MKVPYHSTNIVTINDSDSFRLIQTNNLEEGFATKLFCGKEKPSNFIKSKTNEVNIRLQTDFNDTRAGFTIEYQVGYTKVEP